MRIERTDRRLRFRQFAYAGLLALLATYPLRAPALGLGEPIVKSHLGARLLVQIPLILDEGDRADDIKVRLASTADRARFGNTSVNSTVKMRLAVVMSGRNGPSISVTSTASVREPALSFVVEVSSSSTRFMREYAILLDPVNYRATLQSAPASPPQPAPSVPRPVATMSPNIDGDRYGPVAPGDTLSELGAKLRADSGVSVSQMSIALFQANPQAFTDNDVNRLVAGAYLRVPNRDESTAMSSRAARERLYGQTPPPPASPSVASTTPAAPSPPSVEPSVTKSTEVAADVSTTPADNAAKPDHQAPLEPGFRLSILAADPPSDSNVEKVISRLSGSQDVAVRDLVARMENARESGEELTRENLELRKRISAADTRITKLAAELRERNEQIAAIQSAIEAKRTAKLRRATVTSSVDVPSQEERPDSLSSTSWQWLVALAALCGVWLLVRRRQH